MYIHLDVKRLKCVLMGGVASDTTLSDCSLEMCQKRSQNNTRSQLEIIVYIYFLFFSPYLVAI